MEFSPTLLAIVPPLLAILLAVITRQVVLSLFIAVFVGAVMLCGGNLWEGFYSTFFDYILPGFEDTDHQRILALTTFCGGLSLLLEKNGGAQAFANAVSRGAGKTRRGAQVLTWLGGVFVWFSDSTNPVLVGPICRSFTDKVKVSREKLAYIVDSTTAAVPTLFPISAWGAYIIGLIATFYTSTGYTGNPQTDFVAGIPYQYYTIGSILMVLIIAVTGWDYGPMKKAEDRALLTGKLYRDGAEIRREIEQEDLPEGAKPSIWNMLVPVIVLLVFIFVGLFYTGDIKTNGFFGAAGRRQLPACAGYRLHSGFHRCHHHGHDQQGLELQEGPEHLHRGLHGHDGGPDDPHAGLGHRQHLLRLRHFHLDRQHLRELPDPHLYVRYHLHRCLPDLLLHRQLLERIRHLHPHRRVPGHLHRRPRRHGHRCSAVRRYLRRPLLPHLRHHRHVLHGFLLRPHRPRAHAAALRPDGCRLVSGIGYIVSGLMKGGAFVGLAITLVLICLVSFLLNKHVGRGKDAKAPQDAA